MFASLGVAVIGPSRLPPQAFLRGEMVAGAVFAESLHSDVVTQSASGQRKRSVDRFAEYTMLLRSDTLVVTVDSLTLHERDAGTDRDIGVDAVTGARWQLVIDPAGHVVVAHTPFVPEEIGSVSDVAVAMDDFFPAVPGGLAVSASRSDSSGTQWRRLADSSSRRRYRWSRTSNDSTGADSLHPGSARVGHEDGDLVWQENRGPIVWHRKIHTTVTTVIAGRPMHADVDQQVGVRRIR
jgi:hypothetical protein